MSDEPEPEEERTYTPKNEYIDKLTLEMFMNKTHYYKYLSKTDPVKFEKKAKHKAQLRKYAVDIIDITSQMIENPDDAPSTEIAEMFDDYVKTIMRYLELKRDENDDDADTLFDPKNFK
jgi:hypothetical protein